jgi:hypothetical protein
MKNISKLFTPKRLKIFTIWFVVIFSFIGILLQSYYKLKTPLLRADFISTLLPASAPFRGLGFPYSDYWEVRPPALPLMTGLWGQIVGDSLWSFHALWLIFLAGILCMSWIILGKIFSFCEKVIVYVLFALLFFANSVQTQFFPPEINGLFFALGGLIFAIKAKPSNRDIFLSTFFFILASQMKEVFAFAGLSLFPHLVVKLATSRKEVWRFLLSVIAGGMLVGIIILTFLFLNHAFVAYKEILHYKSQVFNPTNWRALLIRVTPALDYLVERFLAVPYSALLLISAAAVSLSLWFKENGEQKLLKTGAIYAVAVCYGLGSFVGYLMQDRRNHIYDIAILLAFVLLVALSIKILVNFLFSLLRSKLRKKFANAPFILSPLFIIIFLVPNQLTWGENFGQLKGYSPQVHLARIIDAENPVYTKVETKIKEHTQPSDCIDVQHGWNVGQQYYYTARRPCTRFFLTNILPPERIPEYQSQLVGNPPAAIIFYTELTDLDVDKFDVTIFNFTKVIRDCFVQDEEFSKLYWPILDGEKFQECFKTGLPS